jgi:hypothetical protein
MVDGDSLVNGVCAALALARVLGLMELHTVWAYTGTIGTSQ